MVSSDQPYSQRILEISIRHRFLPQNERKCMGRGFQENPHFCWKKLWSETVVECDIEESETEPCGAYSHLRLHLTKIRGLEVDSNDIDELVEEHNQKLTTEELMELQSV
ncbi:hypothetical protein AVEN_106132-1 [Araneus ventricosus]|uniref:Uncharacterized protein n=1 Tax=Araneus ventricosus TaxID=182803 RepID=A0A4Y2FIJ8_ARAVE|nr:hypothetical protein AVEN_106132-1 [Araneus ventricosus]